MNVKFIQDIKGNEKSIDLKDVFWVQKEINKQPLFDSIVSENAAARQGTHSTLTKGEVRGGGKKPWKQKHTGRARQGSTRSPQWVGGGIAFGPKPNRNYNLKVNSKVSALAVKSALTLKLNSNNLWLISDDLKFKTPSTSSIYNLAKKMKIEKNKILILANLDNDNLLKSCNNIPNIISKFWNQASVKDILNADFVLFQNQAFNEMIGGLK